MRGRFAIQAGFIRILPNIFPDFSWLVSWKSWCFSWLQIANTLYFSWPAVATDGIIDPIFKNKGFNTFCQFVSKCGSLVNYFLNKTTNMKNLTNQNSFSISICQITLMTTTDTKDTWTVVSFYTNNELHNHVLNLCSENAYYHHTY